MPSNATVPPLRGARPMIARKVVVLPTPLRPSTAAASPGLTSRLTPWRMCSLPIWTCTPSSLSMRRLLDVVLVLATTQVGLADALVGCNILRTAGCQDAALCHDGDVGCDPEHDLHVVLDDDDVDGRGELADLRHHALGFRRTHAAGRLVKQKE